MILCSKCFHRKLSDLLKIWLTEYIHGIFRLDLIFLNLKFICRQTVAFSKFYALLSNDNGLPSASSWEVLRKAIPTQILTCQMQPCIDAPCNGECRIDFPNIWARIQCSWNGMSLWHYCAFRLCPFWSEYGEIALFVEGVREAPTLCALPTTQCYFSMFILERTSLNVSLIKHNIYPLTARISATLPITDPM